MKAFFAKLERLFMAVAFAEAGETETARQLAEPRPAAPRAQALPAAGLAPGEAGGR